MTDTAPSAYAIEATVVAWQRLRAQLMRDNPEMDQETLDDITGREAADIETIQVRLVRARQEKRRFIAAIKADRDELAARSARFEREVERINAALMGTMIATGRKTAVLPNATITITTASARPRITDETKIPEQYVTTETVTVRKVNTPALYNDLIDGLVVDGAELSNPIPHITVRTR